MVQTKQEIRGLLAGAGAGPRHRWGQNFLIDLNLMRLLVEAAGLRGDEVVLEAGTGTGSLTALLSDSAGAVVTVEIDPALQAIARGQLTGYENVTLIGEDVLTNKNTLNP